jgi:hypothetical protein
VISEFAIPRNAFAAYLARGVIGLLYRAFGLLTGLRVRALPDYAALFSAAAWCPATTAVIWPGSCAPRSGPHVCAEANIPSRK